MLINAIDTTLEDAKKSFNRVGMDVAPDIFAIAMSYDLMFCKFLPHMSVLPCIIGHKVSFVYDMLLEDRLQGVSGHVWHMKGSDPAITLHQGKDSVFMSVSTALFHSRLSSHKGFVGFNRPISSRTYQQKWVS